jgi:hypothetical protein
MTSFRLSEGPARLRVTLSLQLTTSWKNAMKLSAPSMIFDNILYLLAIFVPTSILLGGALAAATLSLFA